MRCDASPPQSQPQPQPHPSPSPFALALTFTLALALALAQARRELAKQLRAMTGASARTCEKALQSHADDMERAANWLLDQGEQKGEGTPRE